MDMGNVLKIRRIKMGRKAMDISRIRDSHPSLGTKEQCVIEHRKLVLKIANHYESRTFDAIDIEDLISEGNYALLMAYDRFDEKSGLKFSTFAYPYIQGFIIRYLECKVNAIRTPSHSKVPPKLVLSLDSKIKGSDNDDLDFSNLVPTKQDLSFIEIEEFINTLKETERTIVNMTMDGYSNGETAAALKICRNTVSNIKVRIRKKYLLYVS
jgi:RNA polymerase sigma factor (sigma-70 family)